MENKNQVYAKMRLKFRSDTLKQWNSEDPILLSGEMGIVTGFGSVGDGLEDKTQKIKIGDGIHKWTELEWWYGPEGKDYILTDTDKTEIADIVLSNFVDVAVIGQ